MVYLSNFSLLPRATPARKNLSLGRGIFASFRTNRVQVLGARALYPFLKLVPDAVYCHFSSGAAGSGIHARTMQSLCFVCTHFPQ